MLRIAAIYGGLSGLIVITSMIIGIVASGYEGFFASQWFGYLIMLVALSLIFVGVKRYRDIERGGVVTFVSAFLLGLAIASIAGVMYVAVWEVYLASTDYAFMEDYVAGAMAAHEAAGLSGDELAAKAAELDAMRTNYQNPLFRIPITFSEIFPVGFLVALASAAALRNPNLLPHRA